MIERKDFGKKLLISIALLLVGFVVSFVLIIGWLGVIGIPIGLFLACLSIWYFAMWFYKKDIPIKIASILFIIPLLVIVSFASEHAVYLWEHNNTPLGQALPSKSRPLWLPILAITPWLSWIVGMVLLVWFFIKAKKL